MKKTFITSVMLAATIFTFSAVNNAPANATCPAKEDCAKAMPMPMHHPHPGFKPMSPEEHAKLREARKAEFETRLNLTEEQKAKIEELKASEDKALKSCREKIKKEQAKLDKLIAEDMAGRKATKEKIKALLTEEQKAELQKMHEEMKAKRAEFVPCSCDCGCPACQKHHDEMKAKHCPKGPEATAPEAETTPAVEEKAPLEPASVEIQAPAAPSEEAKPAEQPAATAEPVAPAAK